MIALCLDLESEITKSIATIGVFYEFTQVPTGESLFGSAEDLQEFDFEQQALHLSSTHKTARICLAQAIIIDFSSHFLTKTHKFCHGRVIMLLQACEAKSRGCFWVFSNAKCTVREGIVDDDNWSEQNISEETPVKHNLNKSDTWQYYWWRQSKKGVSREIET